MSSSSGASAVSRKPSEEVGGGDLALAARALGHERRAEREQRGRQVGGRVAVGDRAADRAAVAHLRVADLAGGVLQQRHVLGEQVGCSRGRGGG